jgi:hypothetical protein
MMMMKSNNGMLTRHAKPRHDTSLRRASAGDNWVECGAAGVCCRMVAMGIHFPNVNALAMPA